MAAPPFLPDETKPGDNDVVSQFPALERAFRDIIEDWLLVDHDTAGEHAQVTLAELGADPTNATDTGFLYTKDDGGDTELYYEDDGGAVVQLTLDGALNVAVGVLDAPTNTSMLFYQSAAPTGWTKDTTAGRDNHAIRVVTSTAWSSGSKGATPFTTVFGSGKATASHVLTVSQMPAHTHGMLIGDSPDAAVASGGNQAASASNADTQSRGGGGGHTHTLSLDLNYLNVIRATKD